MADNYPCCTHLNNQAEFNENDLFVNKLILLWLFLIELGVMVGKKNYVSMEN